jgi:mannose-6-phosphate isomerase-like protein (cupin superfamily)
MMRPALAGTARPAWPDRDGGRRDIQREPEPSGRHGGRDQYGQPRSGGRPVYLDGGTSEGRFSLVEHPFIACGIAAPLHRHSREDEYSYILEGRWGFWQDGKVAFAGPCDLVFKPRDVWRTFWNATDQSGRLLEIISPAGFDQFFAELAALVASGLADTDAIAALNSGYGLQADPDGTARIAAEHRLVTVAHT